MRVIYLAVVAIAVAAAIAYRRQLLPTAASDAIDEVSNMTSYNPGLAHA